MQQLKPTSSGQNTELLQSWQSYVFPSESLIITSWSSVSD